MTINGSSNVNYGTINPIDEITELSDVLIKSEREKIALLERLMETMNEKK